MGLMTLLRRLLCRAWRAMFKPAARYPADPRAVFILDLRGDNAWRVGPLIGERADGHTVATLTEGRRIESEAVDLEGPKILLNGDGSGRVGPTQWWDS